MNKPSLRKWQGEALEAVKVNIDKRPLVWAVMGAGKSIAIASLCLEYKKYIIIITTPTVALVEQLADTLESVTGELIGRVYTKEKRVHRVTVVCHNSIDLIEDTPDLWIADEAHKTEAPGIKEWAERVQPVKCVGFTATPWRSSDRESVSLFDECVYEYGPEQAFADKVVVMPRLVYHGQDGDTVDEQCIDFICSQTGPGVCNAQSIEDAERFAEKLEGRLPVMVVHSRGRLTAKHAVDFLYEGGRRVVIYVSMLAEGFDCPPIQWLVARRAVGSRVRFAQEIGRGLRSFKGKTECLVFDPHRLFQKLSLSYEACLGVLPPVDEPVPVLNLEDIGLDIAETLLAKPKKDAKYTARVSDYLYEIRCELQFRGVLDMKLSKAASKRSATWRTRDVSDKQVAMVTAVAKAAGRHSAQWPARIRDVLRIVWPDVPFLNQGAVSDLIEILKCSKQIAELTTIDNQW